MMFSVHNLTKVFTVGFFRRKAVNAVNNVSFELDKGEIVSLVGESGSGKTTTAHMILRLIRPTSGEIFFEGKNVLKLKTMEERKKYWRQVHGIFQDPYAPFNPMYKIDRVLYQVFNLYDRQLSRKEKAEIVKESLSAVGLIPKDILGKYSHQLSGGQRQRIMVARCYILKPKLILADEPVSMIDASTRAGVIKLFMKLCNDLETSVMFITHDLGLAYYTSNRILIMRRGEIVEEASAESLLEHPQHPYTKRLLNDVPLLYSKWKDL